MDMLTETTQDIRDILDFAKKYNLDAAKLVVDIAAAAKVGSTLVADIEQIDANARRAPAPERSLERSRAPVHVGLVESVTATDFVSNLDTDDALGSRAQPLPAGGVAARRRADAEVVKKYWLECPVGFVATVVELYNLCNVEYPKKSQAVSRWLMHDPAACAAFWGKRAGAGPLHQYIRVAGRPSHR